MTRESTLLSTRRCCAPLGRPLGSSRLTAAGTCVVGVLFARFGAGAVLSLGGLRQASLRRRTACWGALLHLPQLAATCRLAFPLCQKPCQSEELRSCVVFGPSWLVWPRFASLFTAAASALRLRALVRCCIFHCFAAPLTALVGCASAYFCCVARALCSAHARSSHCSARVLASHAPNQRVFYTRVLV